MKKNKWVLSEFDSKILKCKVAKVTSIVDFSKKGVEELVDEFVENNVDYATARVNSLDIKKLSNLGKKFYLIDGIIELSIVNPSIQINDDNIRKSKKKDLKTIIDMSKNLYINTRYSNDEFTKKFVNKIYAEWIKNSLNKEVADEVLVFEDKSVLGFISIKKRDKKIYEIPLLGVSGKAQGRGIGKVLVAAAITYCVENGAEGIYIDTQVNNIPALRAYISSGFKPSSSYLTFAWRRK